jgi:hypothetical protein
VKSGFCASYDGKMQNVATAAAIGLVTGISGGVIGYFIARLLVERLAIVEGPAGVLLVILPPGLAALSAGVGFFLALWRLWKGCWTEDHSGSMTFVQSVRTTSGDTRQLTARGTAWNRPWCAVHHRRND